MIQTIIEHQVDTVENQLAKHAIAIHKFGGSSLADAACIERVVDIICQHCQLNDVVVVSANGDTTDQLFDLLNLANSHDDKLLFTIEELQLKQERLIEHVLKNTSADQQIALLAEDIQQLTAWLLTAPKIHANDILAFGELWSARLLAAVLNERICPSYFIDARQFLTLDGRKTIEVNMVNSRTQLTQLQMRGKLAVVTGYIAKDSEGQTCTLGRNGSDYSATIMASLLGSVNVTLWTDVDGIYSADPRMVPLARKLNRLPREVAQELGRLGNPILHAKTLQPLTEHNSHLHVASSFAAQITGTEIGNFGQIAKQELSVTYLNDLLLAYSDSFKGASGKKACQQFSVICADTKAGFVVITLAQQKALSQWLASHDTEVTFRPVAIMATVGYQVARQVKVKARFKRALKNAQALKFVSSDNEHSHIAILPAACSSELLNHVHHYITKDARHVGLVVAGLGNIGQRFLELLPEQLTRLTVLENVHLVALVGSKKYLLNTDGLEPEQALSLFTKQAIDYQQADLLAWLQNHPYDELVVVDITPSESFSLLYQDFFQQGIHVIGANKWAASSSTEHYQALKDSAKKHHSVWLGNTTVGAGLPINYSVDDLIKSGDTVSQISGIFSGTLSWLFERYDGSQPFSELLRSALTQGLTEPDPREDLSGRDVQRKLLILARAAGLTLSLEDISCHNLVPEALQNLTTEAFLQSADQLDNFFEQQLTQALNKQAVIRYVARLQVSDGKITASVGLETLSQDDVFAHLTPGDNIFQLNSSWYQDNPLIIRGPGAGRDVTAGGLHSDLVHICQYLAYRKQPVNIKRIN